jgi:FG-GAP-like repeat/Abnormal spindle-like microcephaly-assoc'd, ASPM-SPD-2-Hydin
MKVNAQPYFLVILCLFVMGTACPAALAQTNPVPLINQPLAPTIAQPGGAGFTLTVNGTGFVAGSAVNWNGSVRATTFVSSAQLTASITAADIAAVTTAFITVSTPVPGGGTSNAVLFQVTNPASAISLGRTDSSLEATVPTTPQAISADFNKDGQMDLAATAVLPGGGNGVAILMGSGNGTFSETDYPLPACGVKTGCMVTSLAAGDFNGDGNLDLAVTQTGDNTLTILSGNGTGGFTGGTQYSVGSVPGSVATGDFNRDGFIDLAVVNQGGGTVSILLGGAGGTFQPASHYAAGASPFGVAVGDLNHDGLLDLVVTNPGASTVSVLIGNGDGTFQRQVSYPAGAGAIGIAAADLNGDGRLDLITANGGGSSVSVLIGNGDGTFQAHKDFPTGQSPQTVAVGDFNGDGKLDVAVADECSDAPAPPCGTPGSLSILLGNGDGTLKPFAEYATNQSSASLAAGDFNADGSLDLAAIGSGSTSPLSTFLQIPAAVIAPSSLTFGNQGVDITSLAQTVTLSNSGSAPMTVAPATITGTNSGDFAQGNNCNSSLPVGSSCTISVTFTPTTGGTRAATLTITDNAMGSPQGVTLGGTGIFPTVTITPKAHSYEPQPFGGSSIAKKTTVANSLTSGSALVVSSITITGADSADYTLANDLCSSPIAPGKNCTFGTVFSPTGYGTRKATINIFVNAAVSPQIVTLNGTGPDFAITASPTSLTVTRGNSVTSTLTITPKSGFNQTVTLSCTSPQKSTCAVSPSSVTLDGIDVQVATMTVTTTAGSTPGTFSLNPKGTFGTLTHSTKVSVKIQ